MCSLFSYQQCLHASKKRRSRGGRTSHFNPPCESIPSYQHIAPRLAENTHCKPTAENVSKAMRIVSVEPFTDGCPAHDAISSTLLLERLEMYFNSSSSVSSWKLRPSAACSASRPVAEEKNPAASSSLVAMLCKGEVG